MSERSRAADDRPTGPDHRRRRQHGPDAELAAGRAGRQLRLAGHRRAGPDTAGDDGGGRRISRRVGHRPGRDDGGLRGRRRGHPSRRHQQGSAVRGDPATSMSAAPIASWRPRTGRASTRVVLASSNHAVGYCEPRSDAGPDGLAADIAARPDSFYGWSKATNEALGSVVRRHLRHGRVLRPDRVVLRQAVRCAEPGDLDVTRRHRPADGGLPDDTEGGFRLIWGVSPNTRRWWDLSAGDEIGYHPVDDSEPYAEELIAEFGAEDLGRPGAPAGRREVLRRPARRTNGLSRLAHHCSVVRSVGPSRSVAGNAERRRTRSRAMKRRSTTRRQQGLC